VEEGFYRELSHFLVSVGCETAENVLAAHQEHGLRWEQTKSELLPALISALTERTCTIAIGETDEVCPDFIEFLAQHQLTAVVLTSGERAFPEPSPVANVCITPTVPPTIEEQQPGEFTRMFFPKSSPNVPAARLIPPLPKPGEFTEMFNITAARISPRETVNAPGEFTRSFPAPGVSPIPSAPPQLSSNRSDQPGDFTRMFERPIIHGNPPPGVPSKDPTEPVGPKLASPLSKKPATLAAVPPMGAATLIFHVEDERPLPTKESPLSAKPTASTLVFRVPQRVAASTSDYEPSERAGDGAPPA